MKKWMEIALLLCTIFGFWGMIYPDLCFTEEVCQVVYMESKVRDENSLDNIEEGTMEDIFSALSKVGAGQIRIKSRFLFFIS